MQEGSAASHRSTNLGTKLNSSPCFTTNHGPYMSLNQVYNAIGHAARIGVQHALLSVHLADYKKLLPPMGLQARKHCTGGDHGNESIKIPLQVVKLKVYGSFYFA